MQWTLEHVSDKIFRITNRTGSNAVNVTMSALGPVLMTTQGERNWSQSFDIVPDGSGPAIVMELAIFTDGSSPSIRIVWYMGDEPQVQLIPLRR